MHLLVQTGTVAPQVMQHRGATPTFEPLFAPIRDTPRDFSGNMIYDGSNPDWFSEGAVVKLRSRPFRWTDSSGHPGVVREKRKMLEKLVCPNCLRIRGPYHWILKTIGCCDDYSW